jgi:hypothetical protein
MNTKGFVVGVVATTTLLALTTATPAQAGKGGDGKDWEKSSKTLQLDGKDWEKVGSDPNHTIYCRTDSGNPYDRVLWGGAKQKVGPALIQCTAPPDTLNAGVLVYVWATGERSWEPVNPPELYSTPTTYKHIYQLTGCNPATDKGLYKTYSWLKACHGTCILKSSWSGQATIDCA